MSEHDKTILIIESEAATRDALAGILGEAGYGVVAVADMDLGLGQIESNPALAAILLQEPESDAAIKNFMGRIRALVPHSALPVIVTTSAVALGRFWHRFHGFTGLIRKPVEPEALLAEVRRCLGTDKVG